MAAIIVKNVTKQFRIYKEKNSTLKERFLYARRTKYSEFLALDNVSLTINKGETIGLIGKNGSGKSTLLKMMTKILYPDQGTIRVEGRVSSLLELGAGFHPDFSGRENIYMNASILGLSKKEIDDRMDDIIRFSELEEFIDHPIRSYSSGMYMRLAFSVAINVEPDVLLVDEVLAVGDASFQRKCLKRLRDLKRRGVTIVFVSHDLGVMERLCDKIYWINDGIIKEEGDPKRCIDAYLAYMHLQEEHRHFEEESMIEMKENLQSTGEISPTSDTIGIDSEFLGERWGTKEVEIINIRMKDKDGNERFVLHTGDAVQISMDYVIRQRPESIVFGVGFFTLENICCYGTNTFIEKIKMDNLPLKGRMLFTISDVNLLPGTYRLDVAAHSDDGVPYDYQRNSMEFEVRSLVEDIGITRIPHKWELQELS